MPFAASPASTRSGPPATSGNTCSGRAGFAMLHGGSQPVKLGSLHAREHPVSIGGTVAGPQAGLPPVSAVKSAMRRLGCDTIGQSAMSGLVSPVSLKPLRFASSSPSLHVSPSVLTVVGEVIVVGSVSATKQLVE